MPSLIAEKLGLTLPIFKSGRSGMKGGKPPVHRDPRFLTSGSGKLTGFKVLTNISFELRTGDRLGIVGRNGSGKSTLLSVLGGIYEPTEGELKVDGKVRGIFNLSLGLNNDATGYRNIQMLGLVAGLTLDEIEHKIPEIAEFSELDEFLMMPVSVYSSGMRMRLLFATFTAFRPEILLLDEWLGTGDVNFRQKAGRKMQEIVEDAGIVVLASHNHKLLQENCNVSVWLEGGQIAMYGDTQEVIAAYEDQQAKIKNAKPEEQQSPLKAIEQSHAE
ncbi:ABC transporter ATP-binding protein [Aquisalinus flavus]|uniref:ABC transporter ATP-binding protein n=1 Tax=Aquisalinus flavus TaxID=1526572 RepID=A0A8J2V673_9PROT|nr:ABC transporter ATP-binding protein [Aquisalinus flavus]MBD0426224.1 ABC transporter ATP-binding protein [Aquisalinus flavus]UNE48204.1 ABC transporter ATP-binding protein [Aquisalinus flavus]GGD09610.1 ABC transporter ATP-binding protein [Aquisalinus flavus]